MSAKSTESVIANYFATKGVLFFHDHSVSPWMRQQLIDGYNTELEHGKRLDRKLDVTHDNVDATMKIALAHMREFPDYYERLKEMEREAEKFWETNADQSKRKDVEALVVAIAK